MKKFDVTRFATKFCGDDRGNVAMIAALSVIPILSVVGLAMDLQMTSTQRSGVQQAVDSAVIAGAKSLQKGKTKKEIEKEINEYVDALISDRARGTSCGSVAVTLGQKEETIHAYLSCSQKTTMSHIFGREKMKFHVESGSAYGVGDVEVAMVFDVSGSMGYSGRMDDLKEAADNAIDILLPKDDQTGAVQNDGVRIAMVSYDTMMNAGEFFSKVTGMDADRTIDAEYEVCTKYKRSGWKRGRKKCVEYGTETLELPINNTCVTERGGDDAFTDIRPGNGAWITPDVPKVKFDRWSGAPYLQSIGCNDFGPLPLTNNRQKLEQYVKALEPDGGTAGHLGVAWGWYALSPNWSNVWPSASEPASYNSAKTTKAIIMMTDGEFLNSYDSSLGDSNEQALAMCNSIKQEGVLIYTVAFQAPDEGKEMLANCATSDEFAFKPATADELNDSYANIARSISDLRISQ